MYNIWHQEKFPLTYKIKHPLRTAKTFARKIKFSHQRITRGWCDADAWNMGTWFLNVVPDQLRYLSNNTHSYPLSVINDKEWKQILLDMAEHFVLAGYTDNEDVIKHKDKAFELMKKHFYDLWD